MCTCRTAVRRRRSSKFDPRYISKTRRSVTALQLKLLRQIEKDKLMQARKGKKR